MSPDPWDDLPVLEPAEHARGAISMMDGIADCVPDCSALELAELLYALRDVAAAVGHVRKLAEAELIRLGENVDHPVYGLFEIRRAKSRKAWDHSLVAWKVAAEAINRREPNDDGEIEPAEHAAVAAVLDAAGIGYWRVGVLRDLGLDPDAYCDVQDDGHTVQLPARDLTISEAVR